MTYLLVESIEMVGSALKLAELALGVDDGHRTMERVACPFCQAKATYKQAQRPKSDAKPD